MSDNEIIKALECCKSRECSECKRIDSAIPEECECRLDLMEKLYTLINRQKAEIDRLQKVNEVMETNTNSMCLSMPNMAKAERVEAIKEFAERLKSNYRLYNEDLAMSVNTFRNAVDNLVKEMTENEGKEYEV